MRPSARRGLGAATVVILVLSAPRARNACVQVRTTNCAGRTVRVAMSPADLCIEVRVTRHPDNRRLVIAWDDAPPDPLAALAPLEHAGDPVAFAGSSGRSELPLDGERASILQLRRVRGWRAGRYQVVARVEHVNGRVRCEATTTLILY